MRRHVSAGCALIGLLACTGPVRNEPGREVRTPPAAAEQEVIAVAEALFSAMHTRDTAQIRTLFVPEAQVVPLGVDGPLPAEPQMRSVSEFVTSIGRPGEPLIERMWEPRVNIDHELASLWAPYDFHIGERFSHCGSNAFHLVRQPGGWRILALAYTVQTTGCVTGD
jgi:hypothetical protein